MPSNPEIEQKLAEQAAAKKRGEPLSFGQARQDAQYRTPPERPRATVNTAREMVDLETMFGQQAIALEANLRAMLFTLRQLQQARMRIYGPDDADLADLDRAGQDLARQAQKVGIAPDGFITPKE